MESLLRYIAKQKEKQVKEALQKAIRDYPGIPGNKRTTTGPQSLFKDILLSDFLRMKYVDSSWIYHDSGAKISAQIIYYPDKFKYEVTLKKEYFNNGGSSNYIRLNSLSIVVVIVSKLIRDVHYSAGMRRRGKEYEKYEIDQEDKVSFSPRNVSTAEDIALLNGKIIKDAVLRFGLNREKGVYSEKGKIIAIQLEDGTLYELHGNKLPWHRFGDYSIDYCERDPNGESEFEGMEEQKDGTFEARYSYRAYEREDPYADYYEDWEEMAEGGAQFSWMD